jgi:hypothetical protein
VWAGSRPGWYPPQREFLLGLYDIGEHLCPLPVGDLPIGANMAGLRQVILDHGRFEETMGPNYFKKRKMITGEETILGQRIRASGHGYCLSAQGDRTASCEQSETDSEIFSEAAVLGGCYCCPADAFAQPGWWESLGALSILHS